MKISVQLQQAVDKRGLTLYGLARLIGAETDEPLKTIHQRLSRYIESPPASFQHLEEILDVLGMELVIQDKTS